MSFLLCPPSVFVIGNEYEILVNAKQNAMLAVQIDGTVYYEENSELDKYCLENKDILMAMTGGTVGKTYLVNNLNEKMYVNQRVATIRIIKTVNF